MKKTVFLTLILTSTFLCNTLSATTPSTSSGLPGQPTKPPEPPKKEGPKHARDHHYVSKPLEKTLLPKMEKPFGMPGVMGYQNGRWEGSDYLGLLSNHVTVFVEVLEGEKVPKVSDSSLTDAARAIFTKEGLTPEADVEEGPLLPFFHLLVIVYPATPDESFIYTSGRLFENIEVKRNNFEPKGYWQGITWETQDMTRVGNKFVDDEALKSVEKVTKEFVKRYRSFNPENPDLPKPPKLESVHKDKEKEKEK